ncbi:translation initiation factor 3 subunit H [Tremella mesenterica]|uniref:Translation initiation factor 3 subunit H n=1 Tax=Tremella mesenterica TaxID=5217 RepID=A0A4Q1BID1_TREME|nr:uncharacterized protein TREMEDRAFT_71591 [Tremella mesenterica DSM 1558]EIW69263.1 hypothetical protein TREMEDRAFT_71591 [Tremella mesenterica DSM 1558]RXK37413.1 translation initiation factor 3 subunit H [Tremella mesenterica]
MTSMAAALAASLPTPVIRSQTPKAQGTKVPQRLEAVVDPDAKLGVETVRMGGLVLLKIIKHSTDSLPPPPQNLQQDRNPPPTTALSAHVDAQGVLLGLDLEGVMEVEDCFALPGGDTNFTSSSYSARLIDYLRASSSSDQLRGASLPDSPVGIYLSTHNGGFVTRSTIELLLAVERVSGRGKAVLVIHDASRANGRDLNLKAWRLSDGAKAAAQKGKWDGQSLVENKLTASTLLEPLPLTISSPQLISAFLTSLSTPAPSPNLNHSLRSPAVTLSKNFETLSNPLPRSLPAYLSDTLDSLTLHAHEANNVAFLVRQQARDRAKLEATAKDREEENLRRKKAGLGELPPVNVTSGSAAGKDPNRLELLCLQGMVDGLAGSMAGEAARGLVRCYL